jgi:UDP-N-acetylglucosamine 4,6-dehydratase/5-epimerase
MSIDLNEKKILITGGTGSLGKIVVKRLLKKFPKIQKLIIFSRDEYKQSKMSRKIGHSSLEFVIGDVRDKARLIEVLKGVDVVIHAAAMKYLDMCEKNPEEALKTNVLGTHNVIEAALLNRVKNVVFISTDKAVEPISAYGKSKEQAENKILEVSNNSDTQFSILRLGNIFQSRGSVFSVFEDLKESGQLTIYDKRSTRFLIKDKQLYKSILHAISFPMDGVVIIPKLKVFKVAELAKAYCFDCKVIEKPLRKGERIHEFLFSSFELQSCYEDEGYFYIVRKKDKLKFLKETFEVNKTPEEDQPLSSENGDFFSLNDLKKMITSDYLKV